MKWALFLAAGISTTTGFNQLAIRPFPSSRLFSTDVSSAPTENSNSHQVYIGNLPYDIQKETLESLVKQRTSSFQQVRVPINRETGLSRGFAFLDFASREAADAASAALAGMELDGRLLKIDSIGVKGEKPASVRGDRKGPRDGARPRSQAQVFIGNLGPDSREDDLRALITNELGDGKVTAIRMGRDREGNPRGFAHIDCSSPEVAEEVVSKLNGASLNDRQIRADIAERRDAKPQRAGNPSGRDSTHSIFVANLPWDATPELLEDMVNDLVGEGSFVRLRLAVDRETGRPRGFGHIDLTSAEAAERAVREIDGVDLMGRELRADFATERGDRRKGSGSSREKGDRYDNNRESNGSFGAW